MTKRLVLVAVVLVLAACQARGPADGRLGFRFQWLSYLQGDDIRATCQADGADRVRLIYNADFNSEIRTYDLYLYDGSGQMDTRRWVSSGTVVVTGGSINAAFDPTETGKVTLTAAQVQDLKGAFEASGFPGSVPVGDILRSDAHFWVALACVDGVFGVQVWNGDRLRQVRFAGLLESLDSIGQPLPPAQVRDLPPFGSVVAANRRDGDPAKLFYEAEVGEAALRAWWRT